MAAHINLQQFFVEALATLKWQDTRHSLVGANIPLHNYIIAHWRQHWCQLSRTSLTGKGISVDRAIQENLLTSKTRNGSPTLNINLHFCDSENSLLHNDTQLQSYKTNKQVHQGDIYCFQNTLKLTYEPL